MRRKTKPPAKVACSFELNDVGGFSLVHKPECDGTCTQGDRQTWTPLPHANGVAKVKVR